MPPTLQILKFGAPWCGPCRVMKTQRTLEVAQERLQAEGISVGITELDVEKDTTQRDKYGIQAVPSIVVLRGETIVKRIAGFVSADQLVSAIAALDG